MPNYDLRCSDCNTEHKISATMKEKSENKIACPTCGSFDLETVFRAPPGIIKGAACPTPCGASCRHAG